MMSRLSGLVAVVTLTVFAVSSSFAAKEPVLIAWPDLMPQEPVLPDDLDFGDDQPEDQTYDADLGGVVQHGMSPARPGLIDPSDVVTEYNDVQVKIAGYVLPLDFENTNVKEFLLVPYVGGLHPRAATATQPDHLCHQRRRHRGWRHVRASLGNRQAPDRIALQ